MSGTTAYVIFDGVALGAVALLALKIKDDLAKRRRTRGANDALAKAGEADGWSVVPAAEAAAELGPLVTWRAARRVMVRHGDAGDFWFTWHFWISYHRHGRAIIPQHHHRSRFIAPLSNSPTDGLIAIQRRSPLGRTLKRVWGMGTGDAEFDRRFVVKPADDPVAVAIATPAVREALMSGAIPPFSVFRNFVSLSYEYPPWPNIIAEGTRAITALSDLLRSGA